MFLAAGKGALPSILSGAGEPQHSPGTLQAPTWKRTGRASRSHRPRHGRPGQAALHGHSDALMALGGRTRRKTRHCQLTPCLRELPGVPMPTDATSVPQQG